MNKSDIYTCYIDFQCAFNSSDHDLMFEFLTKLGLPTQYVTICKQLYSNSRTYFTTPHGQIPEVQIDRGTLQGDTLSPYLFTLFIEPLLRRLEIGSRGYRPSCTRQAEEHTLITYDALGFADDLTINTGNFPNMVIQLKKLAAYSLYTKLDLAPDKCEATAALWSKGTPIGTSTLIDLRQQISTIRLPDHTGTPQPLVYLPPQSTHKLLGVQITPLLRFSQHFQDITEDVRKLAKVLRDSPLSTSNKLRATETLLKSKYFSLGLGLLTSS